MKRLSSGTWFLISLMLLAMGVFFWLWGDRVRGQRSAPANQPDIVITNGQVHLPNLGRSKFPLLTHLQQSTVEDAFASSKFASSNTVSAVVPTTGSIEPDPRFPYRLRNTKQSVGDLAARDSSILLNNALIDTSSGVPLGVPEHLRADAATESYLLQSIGPFDHVFDEASLDHLGIVKVAYIPHNTWIVRMTPDRAQQLKGFRGTQSVLPFDPYFKLSDSLLEFAVMQADIPGSISLQLTLFPGAEEGMFAALEAMGTEYLADGESPFGRTVIVKTERAALSGIASLDGVLTVEQVAPRVLANDLTRVRLGVDTALTNLVSSNFHQLTGKDILVNVNDTGIDSSHPDLSDRVFALDPENLSDPEGHGTHVAGIIGSSGANSPMITNVFGSPTNANFRGMAPESSFYVLPIDLITGPVVSDEFLQTSAAEYNFVEQNRTNALISNNSWSIRNLREYNTSAASFDAAARDALPEMEGSQPVLYVFAAGNSGSGDQAGRRGEPSSISSPGTAKNVITVGALESLRFITNEVVTGFIDEVMTNDMDMAITNKIPIMERLFQPPTDSATEVTSFSGRGNVGIGIEGDFGRFKPDVVAPGSFIISTRATNWVSPEQFLNVVANTISNQTAIPGELTPYVIFAPNQVTEIEISIERNEASPDSLPRLPIYATFGATATTNNLVGFTSVTINEEDSSPLTLQPGVLSYSIGNPIDEPISFDVITRVSTKTEVDGYFDELETLNDGLAPHYRFESGTSMAAPAVTGLLALFQEFLRENGHNPSPALLKALLINGSRTASELYDFQIDPVINFQGWGTVNLANSLPDTLFQSETDEAAASLEFFDQSPEMALATGEHRSWNLILNTNEARALPLRLSLVWTDPPGNPSAGIKLVNDLDLIVSNTVSGEIFYGNHFGPSQLFSSVTASNTPPRLDNVNNVENVFITPPLSTNYVVSVVARRVNVNAVTDHPDGVVQDFALVVSSGDNPEFDDPFRLEPIEELEIDYVEIPALVSITNSIPRLADRVGANAPLLGMTNGLLPQWQFYVFTNSLPSTNDVGFTNGPNVAFVTFLPPNLSRPRNLEADVDLFVSRDSSLLDLDDIAIRDAAKSTEPGGSEVVIFENQPLGDDVIYYIGVKSEDHQGGQYAFVGISQENPFDEEDENGNRILRGVPLNQGIIPDGSPNNPGAALTLALGNPLNGLTIQSAISQLSLVHEDIGDLLGNVSHNGVSVVLNNHTLFNPDGTFGDLDIVYDDLENIMPSFPTDGPGNLINFIGENGTGVWLMSMVDNATTHTGRVFGFNMILTPNRLVENEGLVGIVQPQSFIYYVIEVPTDASGLVVNLTEFDLPLDLYLRREELPTLRQYDKRALGTNDSNGLTLRLNRRDIPPLNPGQYFVGVYNPNLVPVEFRLTFNIERDLLIDSEQPYFAEELAAPLTDDAITRSSIFVSDTRGVADIKVGLRIDHPRASDLTMHLVSPLGTRVLLSENRGGTEATGWGAGPPDTATFGGFSDDPGDALLPIKFAPPPYSTNSVVGVDRYSSFEEVDAGSIFVTGDTFQANVQSNLWEVLNGRAIIAGPPARAADGVNFLNLASARLSTVLPTEPGRKVDLFYSTRSSAGRGAPVGEIFLGGQRAQTVDGSFEWLRNRPVRFTPNQVDTLLELSPIRGRPSMQIDDFELRDAAAVKYFFPEEELAAFDGQPAVGDWSLEVWDNRAGGNEPQPLLQNWQLLLSLAQTNFPAINLTNGECVTNTVSGDDIQYYIVDVPRIATLATNWLSGTGDLVLLWNEDGIPEGQTPPDIFPPIDYNGEDGGEGMVLSLDGVSFFDPGTNLLERFPTPTLNPGQRYYLGVRNADPNEANEYELCLRFDQDDVQIINLTNTIAFTNTVAFSDELELQYYRYSAGSNVLSMDIEVFPENGDVNVVEKFGLPLPDLMRFENRGVEAGLTAELITITNRAPATIISGDYFIGVYNVEPNQTDVNYSIRVTETTAPYDVIRLPQGQPIEYSVEMNVSDDELAELAIEDYFLISVTNSEVSQVRIDLDDWSHPGAAILQRDALPTLDDNQRIAFGTPDLPGSGRIVIRTNTVLTNLVGDWFLAVLNDQEEDLGFSIRGTTFTNDVPLTDLPSSTWLTNTVVSTLLDEPREVDYYRFVVSDRAVDVRFSVEPIVGGEAADVDLLVRQEFVPTDSVFDFESSAPGSANEFVGLGPDLTGPLSAGTWLLGVFNNENAPVSYRIRVDQTLDLSALLLVNDLWVTNTITGVIDGQVPVLDTYAFDVDPLATSVVFDLEPLSTGRQGNLDLVLRQGDVPDIGTFDSASTNSGNAAESIVIDESSIPRIERGRWFAGVINREIVPVSYRIRAIQFIPPEPPVGPVMQVIDPDVLLIGNEICLSWMSEPGVEYFVEGKVRFDDPIWDGLAGPVVASTERTMECFANTIPYQFFRVIYFEGGVPVPEPGDFVDTDLRVSPTELCVQWEAVVGTVYTVQARRSIDQASWEALSVLVADGSAIEYCVDLPTDFRFFRVGVGDLSSPEPTDPEFIDPTLNIGDDEICVTWVAESGRSYTLQGRERLLGSEWADLESVVADGNLGQICVALPTSNRFFRVRVDVGEPPVAPQFIDPEVAVVGDELCVTWPSQAGFDYVIEGKVTIESSSWSEITVHSATTGLAQYCLTLPTEFRFFRVRFAGPTSTDPLPDEPIAFVEPGVAVSGTDICLDWPSEVGRTYVVQGKRSVADTVWTEVGIFLSEGQMGMFCIERPTDFRFFRIGLLAEAPAQPNPMPGRILDPAIAFVDSQICLSWDAVVGGRYAVQGRAELNSELWVTVSELVAAESSPSFCLDLLTDLRFFRVQELGMTPPPVDPPAAVVGFVDPLIRVMEDRLCIDWVSQSGTAYLLETRSRIDGSDWSAVERLTADGDQSSVCIDGSDQIAFYRVAIIENGSEPVSPPAAESLALDSIVSDGEAVTLSWTAVPGQTFAVEFTDSIPPVWTRSGPVTSATTEFRFVDLVPGGVGFGSTRYYRLVQVEP